MRGKGLTYGKGEMDEGQWSYFYFSIYILHFPLLLDIEVPHFQCMFLNEIAAWLDLVSH